MLPVEKLGSKPFPSAARRAVKVPPGCGGLAGAVLAVVVTWAMPETLGGGAVALVTTLDLLVVTVLLAVVVVIPVAWPPAAVVVVSPPASVVDESVSVVEVSAVAACAVVGVELFFVPLPHAAATSAPTATSAR